MFLSFHTSEIALDDPGAGGRYLDLLAEALRRCGFTTDQQGRVDADDWWFRARKGPWSFFVVLVLLGTEPARWFIYLEGEGDRSLEAADIRAAVHPALEQAVVGIPGVSRIRWHPDWRTLREA